MSEVILTAATAAGQSRDFVVRGTMRANGTHAHITAPLIAGAETATIQKKNADGSYSDYYIAGTLQQVLAIQTGVVVDAAGVYRVDKSVTAAAVGIEISTPDKP